MVSVCQLEDRTEHAGLGSPDTFYYVNLNSLEREKERNEKVEGSHGAFFLILKKKVC